MKNAILDLSFHIRQKDKKIRQITDQTRRERRNENTPSKSHKANLQKLMSIISNLPKSQQDEYNKLKSLADDSPGPKENISSRLERPRGLSFNSRPCKAISEIPYKKHVELEEYQYGLFISDASTASDFVELQRFNINAVLTFGQRNDPSKFTVLKGGYLCIHLEDPSKDLISGLSRICKFIDLNILRGNILIHCCEGNSWSCAATAAYLVKRYKMTLDKALAVVQEGRPSLQMSKIIERQLRRIERAELYN
jgi:hypothetical protein